LTKLLNKSLNTFGLSETDSGGGVGELCRSCTISNRKCTVIIGSKIYSPFSLTSDSYWYRNIFSFATACKRGDINGGVRRTTLGRFD
jgi:hypothetical protein